MSSKQKNTLLAQNNLSLGFNLSLFDRFLLKTSTISDELTNLSMLFVEKIC
jgi:hypothetical protein